MGKIMYKGENFPGGPNVLSELRDINFSNVQDKQIILYDSTSRTWKNHTITADDVAYDANNSVAETISSLNSAIAAVGDSLTVPAYITPYVNRVIKRGNIAEIEFTGAFTSAQAGTGTLIATVPTEFRPSTRTPISIFVTYGNSIVYATASLQTNGNIETALGGAQISGFVHIHSIYAI